MRRIKFRPRGRPETAWDEAVTLLSGYLRSPGKADLLLDSAATGLTPDADRTRRALFLSSLRYAHRVRHILARLVSKPPKPLLEAVLLAAGAEMLDNEDVEPARIVHHAVERAKKMVSKREAAFLNAVLRKLVDEIHGADPQTDAAAYFSHPDWLVERWLQEFGHERMIQLLSWNQKRPKVYLRADDAANPRLDALVPTPWTGFFEVPPGIAWQDHVLPLLRAGIAYIKDPSTRFATELLAPTQGEDVLDLCAAPGGKTRDAARMMGGSGRIVAVDLPGPRTDRLRENMERLREPHPSIDVVESDARSLLPERLGTSSGHGNFDAVLLDAPCSNTGVIQRRTDIKLRLQPESIHEAAELQIRLLSQAARQVRPGGRIVYSTCSIESTENRDLVNSFLHSPDGVDFTLKEAVESYPWDSGHDGAGAYLLVRRSIGNAPASAPPAHDKPENHYSG